MARGINKVTLIGNVGVNPDVRHMANGDVALNFTLATGAVWNDRESGSRVEHTEWHRLVCFGKRADVIAQYVKTGAKLYVEGHLRTRKWQDKKDNIERYATEIVVDEFQMLDNKTDESEKPMRGKVMPIQQSATPEIPQGNHAYQAAKNGDNSSQFGPSYY